MKWISLVLCAGCIALTASFSARAETKAPGPFGEATEDCSLASQPELCKARQKVAEACSDLKGAERRKCRKELMPQMSCGKAQDKARCEKHRAAYDTCEDKAGPEFRQCMGDQTSRSAKEKK
jgi:hypothetical protein